jgi:hypothetical protein
MKGKLMRISPFEKDSPRTQKDRIRRLVSAYKPDLGVEFYENKMDPATTDIRFRLVDESKGVRRIVGSIPQDFEWASSETADKSDAELLQRILEVIKT